MDIIKDNIVIVAAVGGFILLLCCLCCVCFFMNRAKKQKQLDEVMSPSPLEDVEITSTEMTKPKKGRAGRRQGDYDEQVNMETNGNSSTLITETPGNYDKPADFVAT